MSGQFNSLIRFTKWLAVRVPSTMWGPLLLWLCHACWDVLKGRPRACVYFKNWEGKRHEGVLG